MKYKLQRTGVIYLTALLAMETIAQGDVSTSVGDEFGEFGTTSISMDSTLAYEQTDGYPSYVADTSPVLSSITSNLTQSLTDISSILNATLIDENDNQTLSATNVIILPMDDTAPSSIGFDSFESKPFGTEPPAATGEAPTKIDGVQEEYTTFEPQETTQSTVIQQAKDPRALRPPIPFEQAVPDMQEHHDIDSIPPDLVPLVPELKPIAAASGLDGKNPSPDRFVPISNCEGCVFSNMKCTKVNRTDCNAYIDCFYEGPNLRAVRRYCAFGLLWDNDVQQCKYAAHVKCTDEPCKNLLTASYPYGDHCRAYWKCIGSKPVAACCDVGFSYSYKIGCVADNTCTRPCNVNEGETTTKNPECNLLAIATDARKFQQYEASGVWTIRTCAEGSVFKKELCVCVTSQTTFQRTCSPEMWFDFNSNFRDKSGKGVFVGSSGIKRKNGAAHFLGYNKITLWIFSNYFFGHTLTLKLRFKEDDVMTTGVQTLVSNCGIKGPSVDLTINTESKRILFTLDTVNRDPLGFHLGYLANQWNDITLEYNGKTMTGTVNGQSQTEILAGGDIEGRKANMYLGMCGNSRGFRGSIDDFQFYTCSFP